ncbi:hypothetical protein HanXRQr2_Chr14g0658741 [Helianthus annuus]|uniref:Uncharacterized protein n=1 Tax=Helianthus annuus TaxID=4232 RepID=A0A9K3EDB6_HELAN|nr:hypothetical protein HanXRQr2_Chr14g0658741 [Helianthus annuus]
MLFEECQSIEQTVRSSDIQLGTNLEAPSRSSELADRTNRSIDRLER